MTGAHYRLVFRGDQPEESGDADVRVADGVLVLSPPGGEVLRVPMREIASVAADGFCVRITVASGIAIELSRLGVMRTALLADLRDAQVREAAVACGAIGTGETFRAGAEDVRVYEDALLLAGPEGSERVGFSFVTAVSEHDYAVTIEVAGRDAIVLTRLGRRTSELAGLLRARVTQSRNRTAAFVGALLPDLDAVSLRRAAGLLRDGVAVPADALDAIRPGTADTLLRLVTLPERAEPLAELQRRMPLAIGFRQVASVTRPAAGVTPWHDHAITPDFYGHEPGGGSYGPEPGWFGLGGFMAGGPTIAFDASYLFLGGYAGLVNGGGQRPMMPRPDMTRGCLTPAAQDLRALAAAGSEPSVLAFVLGRTGDTVVFEIVNRLAPVTWLYRATGPEGLEAVNRALDDNGFAPPPGPDSPGRPAVLAGQIPHGDGWSGRLAALLRA